MSIIKRITIALGAEDAEILDILLENSANDDMSQILRMALRGAYAQHRAKESDLLLFVGTLEAAKSGSHVLDGVGMMSKSAIDRKFERIP